MNQYNALNVKLCNSKLTKLKSEMKNGIQLTLNISSNAVSESNDETNFRHILLLTNIKVYKLRKAFANGPSAKIKFLKTHLSKMIRLEGFLGNLLDHYKNWFAFRRKCTYSFSQKRFGTLRINTQSFRNRCSYSKENFGTRNNKIQIFK